MRTALAASTQRPAAKVLLSRRQAELSMCWRRKCSSRFVPDTIFSELCDRLCDQYAFPFGELNIQRGRTELRSALSPPKAGYCPNYTHLLPIFFYYYFFNRKLQRTNCLPCWLSLPPLSHFISSFSFIPLSFHPPEPPPPPTPLALPSARSLSLSLPPPLPSIESQSEPASARGRYLVTTEKSIIWTEQWGEKRP